MAVVSQLLAEAFVLAFIGATLGWFVAGGASSVFRSLAGSLPRVEEIRLNGRIVIYSLACSGVATILCGLLPAIRGTRRNISGSLAQANRAQGSGRNRLHRAPAGAEEALAVQ